MRSVCLALVLLSACAHPVVQPGGDVALAPDEGLVALVVDTDNAVHYLSFQEKESAQSLVPKPLVPGKQLQVLKAKAGDYCIDRLDLPTIRFSSRSVGYLCVPVRAGTLTYPGHLALRVKEAGLKFGRSDRKDVRYTDMLFLYDAHADAQALLKKTHPALLARYPLETAPYTHLSSKKPTPPN